VHRASPSASFTRKIKCLRSVMLITRNAGAGGRISFVIRSAATRAEYATVREETARGNYRSRVNSRSRAGARVGDSRLAIVAETSRESRIPARFSNRSISPRRARVINRAPSSLRVSSASRGCDSRSSVVNRDVNTAFLPHRGEA